LLDALVRRRTNRTIRAVAARSSAFGASISSAPSWLDAAATTTTTTPSWLTSSSNTGGFEAFAAKESVFAASSSKQDANSSNDDNNDDDDNNNNDEEQAAEFGAVDDGPPPAAPGPLPPSGEEGESHVFSSRVKLLKLEVKDAKWKELGVGPLRLNIPEDAESETSKFPRVVMRREGVLKLLLNAYIDHETVMEAHGERMVKMACKNYADGALGTYAIKLSTTAERDSMLRHVDKLKLLARITGPGVVAGDEVTTSSS
jgi:hypothetical protein